MKHIFDKLEEIKKLIKVGTAEELQEIVDQDFAYLEGLNVNSFQQLQQALNKRLIDLTQLPIEVSSSNISYIKKPEFIYPIKNSEVPIQQLFFQTDPFKIIGHLRETHRNSHWQIAHDIEMKNLLWERTSIMYKTSIELPQLIKDLMVFGKTYYVRVKYHGKKYQSEWSDVIPFEVQKVLIEKPRLLAPEHDSIIDEHTFKLISSEFKTLPESASTHVKTYWEVAEDEDFTEFIFKESSGLFLTNINVPSYLILQGRKYFVRCQYEDNYGSKSAWSNITSVYSKFKINKPIILTPITDTILSRRSINVTGNEFSTFPISEKKLVSFSIQCSKDLNFTSLVLDRKISSDECDYSIDYSILDFDTVYYLRIKYHGTNEESDWSEVVNIRTEEIKIQKPSILSPLEDGKISTVLFNINCSQFTTDPIDDDRHIQTKYEISKDLGFQEKIVILDTTQYLTFLSVSQPDSFKDVTEVYMRVKYIGVKGESDWSEIRKVNVYTSGLPAQPILEKRLSSSANFGSDSEKNIGTFISDVVLNDSYDKIVWATWSFAEDANFTVNKMEKIVSIDPKVFKLNLNDPYFELDKEYFVRVSFKTLATSGAIFSSPLKFMTGGADQPTIIEYVVTNDELTNHTLEITGSEIIGKNNYNEYILSSKLEISEDINFDLIVDTLTNNTQEVIFNTGNVNYLKKELFFRIQYTGYYFGQSTYSEILKINFGSISKPEIIEHEIVYNELDENTLEVHVNIKSDDAEFPAGRLDQHQFTNWILSVDALQEDILVNETSFSLTEKSFLINLNLNQKLYGFVKYYSGYFGESEYSDPYQIDFDPYIFNPVFVKPLPNQLLLKELVILETKPYKSVPVVSHDKTKWVISSDLEGLDVIWELESVNNLISIPVPNEVLGYGATYYAHVTFFHGEIKSQESIISFSTESTGSLKVVLTPQGAIDSGAQWRRVGTTTWFNSGQVEDTINNGSYEIEFKTATSYNTPNNIVVNISAGTLTEIEGVYDFIDSGLQVTIYPEEAVIDGAQWRRVGTTTWFNSGQVEDGLGEEIVEIEFFNPHLTKYLASENQEVTLILNKVTTIDINWLRIGEPTIMVDNVIYSQTLNHVYRRTPPATVTITSIGDNNCIQPNPKIVNYYTSGSLTFKLCSRIIKTTDAIMIEGAEVTVDEANKIITYGLLRSNSTLTCNYTWLGADPECSTKFGASLNNVRKKEKILKIGEEKEAQTSFGCSLNVVRRKEAILPLNCPPEATTSFGHSLNLVRRKNSIVIP